MKYSEFLTKYNLTNVKLDLKELEALLNLPKDRSGKDTKLGPDTELNQEQITRLLYSKEVHKADISYKTEQSNNKIKTDYEEMVKKYDALVKKMQANPKAYGTDLSEIQELTSLLGQSKGEVDSVTNIINERFSTVRKSVVDHYDEKIDSQNDKLTEQYNKIDKLIKEGKQYQTKFKRDSNKTKIRRVQKKIDRLREKQGRLQLKQRTIVNKGTEKYIKRQTKEYNNYLESVNRETKYVEERNQNLLAQKAHQDDLNLTDQQLLDMKNETGLRARLGRMKLRHEKIELQRNLAGLKLKEGAARLGNQLTRDVTYAMAM